MSTQQTNLDLITQLPELIPDRLEEARDEFSDGFIWTYINPMLPQIEGDYVGLQGLQMFFKKLSDLTGGTFGVRIKQARALGDELVVAHALPAMTLDGQTFETDAAVVWQIVEGKIVRAWDIPAIHNVRSQI